MLAPLCQAGTGPASARPCSRASPSRTDSIPTPGGTPDGRPRCPGSRRTGERGPGALPRQFVDHRQRPRRPAATRRRDDPAQEDTASGEPSGLEIELHWHLLDEGRWPGADDALWRRVQPIQLRDTTVLVPGPEHLLLHVLVHGAQWNAVPPIRWVADAWMILREAGETFDWDVLIEETLARRLVLPIRTCLGYLREAMGAEVPGRVLAELDAAPPSRAEREEFRLLTWPKARRPFWRSLWFRHLRMRRLTASRSWVA
ncbi:MAG: nucleotidyltransferase family protein, partial [Verrucomicrobia bacterium]|nr:nucleotidyltransferase family protein [Verrucomicrobiota bacterium]